VRPLRILAIADVSPLSVPGGAERTLWEQARRLVRRGHDVRVLCRAPAPAPAAAVVREGVRIVEFASVRRSPADLYRSTLAGARRSAARLLAEQDADLINVYQPLSGYGVLASPIGRRLPSLYSFLSPAPLEYRSRERMTAHHRTGVTGVAGLAALWVAERACLRRATRIHVMSDFSVSLVWRLYRIPAERTVKIPGGVDVERFQPAADRRQVRAGLGLPVDGPLLLTVRNLEARMGLDTLIAAMVGLVRRSPELRLLIGGAGSHRDTLERQVGQLGLDKHVTFLGFVPDADLPRYYQAADVFVLPTRELEGFGLVTAEALACGTPVLGTPIGATPELLESLDPALVFSDATAAAMEADLGAFLDRLARDPVGRVRLREACRRHAESRFGWEHVVDDLERAMLDVVERRPLTAPSPATCEACGGVLFTSRLLYNGQRYRACLRCGTRRVVILPDATDVRREYAQRYQRRFPPAQIAGPRRAMLHSVLAHMRSLAVPGRLLDVGCGGGHLVAAARAAGWHAVGADLSREACASGAAAGPVVQADAAALPFVPAMFDAVTLVNVLDHTLRPLTVVQEAARVLRPGGLLVVRIPNAAFHAPWPAMLARLGPLVRWRRWDAYPILHLFAFPPAAVRRLVERAGFDVVTLRNSALAAAAPDDAATRWGSTGRRMVRRLTAVLAGTARVVTGGRWLVGPSIEIYARRRGGATS
jgi:glycosyltransferase involved in cell wall biosynthesis/SAM-dependent methyltransferase